MLRGGFDLFFARKVAQGNMPLILTKACSCLGLIAVASDWFIRKYYFIAAIGEVTKKAEPNIPKFIVVFNTGIHTLIVHLTYIGINKKTIITSDGRNGFSIDKNIFSTLGETIKDQVELVP
ncbi:hypothetical protein D3C81_1319320 [compost metagenome]